MAYMHVEGRDQLANDPGVQTGGSRAVSHWQSEDCQNHQNHPERRNVQKQKDVADFGAIDILAECHHLFHNHGIFLSILFRKVLVEALLPLAFLSQLTSIADFHIQTYLRDDAPLKSLTELSVRAAIYGFMVMLPITWTSGQMSPSHIIYSVWCISAGSSVTYGDALAAMTLAKLRVKSALAIHRSCLFLIFIMEIVNNVILIVFNQKNLSSALVTTLLFTAIVFSVFSVGVYTAWVVLAFKFQLAASVATIEEHGDSATPEEHKDSTGYWGKDCEKAWELLQGKYWVAFRIQIILFFTIFVPHCMILFWLFSNSWRGPVALTVLRFSTAIASLTLLQTVYNLVGAVLYVSCKAYHGENASSNLHTADSYATLSSSPDEVSEEPEASSKVEGHA